MRRRWSLVLALLALGCDLVPHDAPPPVAPTAPPAVTVRSNAPPGVTLFVDAREHGPLRDGLQLQLGPGPHVLEARRADQVVARAEPTLLPGVAVEIALNVEETRRPLGIGQPSDGSPLDAPSGSEVAARDTPTRAEIMAAMRSVEPLVRQCGGGSFHGMIAARIELRGSDGAVSSAAVTGGSPPDALRACVEGVLRRAQVPAFRRATFSVNYPFRM